MIDFDPAHLAAAIALCEPLNIRTIALDVPAFNYLEGFQRKLESWLCRGVGNVGVLKCLIHTPVCEGAGK